MRVVADSHAIVWYVQGSRRLSEAGAAALAESERSDGVVVSVVTLVDLWYVTQTTQTVTMDSLSRLRTRLDATDRAGRLANRSGLLAAQSRR